MRKPQKELGREYPESPSKEEKLDFRVPPPLELWYNNNEIDVKEFEKLMRKSTLCN